MNTLLKTGTLSLAALVTTGLVAWQAPAAVASQGSDDRHGDDRGHHSKAIKRDDDGGAVVTTQDDDDDDTGLGNDTGTNTGTNAGTNTGTNTGADTSGDDDSNGGTVRDLTSDGPGSGNVDHSRHDTNDGTRHNTRG